jgi:hypothetical protein
MASIPSHAQQTSKTPVYLDCVYSPGDTISRALCSSLRDVIVASPRYALLHDEGLDFHFTIGVLSTQISEGGVLQDAFASSVVFFHSMAGSDTYMTHTVAVTAKGRDNSAEQASQILVDLDNAIEKRKLR